MQRQTGETIIQVFWNSYLASIIHRLTQNLRRAFYFGIQLVLSIEKIGSGGQGWMKPIPVEN